MKSPNYGAVNPKILRKTNALKEYHKIFDETLLFYYHLHLTYKALCYHKCNKRSSQTLTCCTESMQKIIEHRIQCLYYLQEL